MPYRGTNDIQFDTPGKYVSSIGIADSTDGAHFIRRPEPVVKSWDQATSKVTLRSPRRSRSCLQALT